MKEFNIDECLLQFIAPEGQRAWTLRDSFEGLSIMGGIGSGKTSGSGRTVALKMLLAGYGGLVLTCKPDEKALWQEYCKRTDRGNDLIVIEAGGKHRFNFLDYESSKQNGRSAITGNLVNVLKTVINATSDKAATAANDSFWQNASDMLLHNLIDLMQLAYGKVTIQSMYDIAQSLPQEGDLDIDFGDPDSFDIDNLSAYQKAYKIVYDRVIFETTLWATQLTDEKRHRLERTDTYEAELYKDIPDARLFKMVDAFFTVTLKNLNTKTRSIVDFTLSGFLFRLLQEPVFSLFCDGESTVTPEVCEEGKIILLNLPIKEYNEIGRSCQIMFKYIFQRFVERRKIDKFTRPLFLYADEAQNFLHEHDSEYQATARSSQIATVYLTQNINGYYAAMGGAKPEYRVKGFLGTLATKVFHANSCMDSNLYASNLIGEEYYDDYSDTTSVVGNFSHSQAKSQKLKKILRPEDFTKLKTGGKKHEFIVEGVVHRQGTPVFFGKTYQIVSFMQHGFDGSKLDNII